MGLKDIIKGIIPGTKDAQGPMAPSVRVTPSAPRPRIPDVRPSVGQQAASRRFPTQGVAVPRPRQDEVIELRESLTVHTMGGIPMPDIIPLKSVAEPGAFASDPRATQSRSPMAAKPDPFSVNPSAPRPGDDPRSTQSRELDDPRATQSRAVHRPDPFFEESQHRHTPTQPAPVVPAPLPPMARPQVPPVPSQGDAAKIVRLENPLLEQWKAAGRAATPVAKAESSPATPLAEPLTRPIVVPPVPPKPAMPADVDDELSFLFGNDAMPSVGIIYDGVGTPSSPQRGRRGETVILSSPLLESSDAMAVGRPSGTDDDDSWEDRTSSQHNFTVNYNAEDIQRIQRIQQGRT